MILGVDEVGRGSWAGPLVVGAVVLGRIKIDGLNDSKKLTKKKRETLDEEIRGKAAGYSLGWVEASEIDEIGLSAALKLATKRAVEQIKVPFSEIIIDGTVNFLSDTNKENYVTTMKKADELVPSVSAASIIAKVARDKYMLSQEKTHQGFGFDKHVGYGTAKHKCAIDKLGITKLHRTSFKPIKNHIEKRTTKQIGDNAEDVACNYLFNCKHKILDRNWKTKFCEIDIVSSKGDVIYFIEVKYRNKPDQGGGLSAITPRKLRQMKFAAEYYAVSNQIIDTNLRLAVVSLSKKPPIVDDFLEI